MHQIVDAYYAFNLLLHIFGDDRLHAICFISSMFAFNQLLCHTQWWAIIGFLLFQQSETEHAGQ